MNDYVIKPFNQTVDRGLAQYSNSRSGGGLHTLSIEKKVTYDAMGELLDEITRSTLFRFDGRPLKTRAGLLYYIKPANSEAQGMELVLLRNKFLPGYLAAHPKDIIVADGRFDDDLTSSILVKTAPKVLAGVPDYLASADSGCVDRFVERFNEICSSVSPVMGCIDDYYLQRTDPCINILLHDLKCVAVDAYRRNGRDVVPWHVVQLIRMGDIPRWFVKGVYPKETDDRSMYLKCRSTNVNIYCKGEQMRSWKSGSLVGIDRADDIVQIEIQMKHRKLSVMLHDKRNWSDVRDMIFSGDWNLRVICRYWKRVVGWGDWYRYDAAEKIVKDCGFRGDKKDRLLGVLRLIRMCGSVSLAKQKLDGREKVVFVNSLTELRKLGVNGVCIPDGWDVEWIPNILEKWLIENDRDDLIRWDDG